MFRTYANALWQTQTLPKGTDKKACTEKRKGRSPGRLTDQQVLECRARHFFFGWEDWYLADHYGTDLRYMKRLLEGVTHAHLIEKPEHANINRAIQ